MRRSPPRPEWLPRVLAGILLISGFASAPPAGASPTEPLETVEQQLDAAKERERVLAREAAETESALAALRRRSVAIAARAQEHEATLTDLENRVHVLREREREATASLEARRRQLAIMLAALQRIALHPPIALIALPTEPVDTVRSALLLREAVPGVLARAATLREELDALSEIAQALAAAREKLNAERAALEEQRTELARLTDEKVTLLRTTREAHREAAERAARLGREARDLRDLVARLATEREKARRRNAARLKPPPAKPAPEPARPPRVAAVPPPASGLPVHGRIERAYGDPDRFGQPSQGVIISTRPGSTVVAPRDGTVVFAGPFRGLGRLLIIEYQGKYHLLLGGMARIDTEVGENVLAGEPVGTMTASPDAECALYMELRRDGQPVNPLPWLAAGRARVNG